mmetsp:Transcript_31778/g.69471  ORF Transcript_31778/g.69471 Transcript_31778/m.69471 type:complete len:310 (-) Transcript_31778:72-1001(-)
MLVFLHVRKTAHLHHLVSFVLGQVHFQKLCQLQDQGPPVLYHVRVVHHQHILLSPQWPPRLHILKVETLQIAPRQQVLHRVLDVFARWRKAAPHLANPRIKTVEISVQAAPNLQTVAYAHDVLHIWILFYGQHIREWIAANRLVGRAVALVNAEGVGRVVPIVLQELAVVESGRVVCLCPLRPGLPRKLLELHLRRAVHNIRVAKFRVHALRPDCVTTIAHPSRATLNTSGNDHVLILDPGAEVARQEQLVVKKGRDVLAAKNVLYDETDMWDEEEQFRLYFADAEQRDHEQGERCHDGLEERTEETHD